MYVADFVLFLFFILIYQKPNMRVIKISNFTSNVPFSPSQLKAPSTAVTLDFQDMPPSR